MKYYLDITLLPDAEANLGFLWQKVYQQLHIAFVEHKVAENQSAIAISIPEYGDKIFPLGSKIRLFSASMGELEKLDIQLWLKRFTDYVHCTSVKDVPSTVSQFACFKRVQFDSNIERLARRRMKRKGETLAQAIEYFSQFKTKQSTLPFVNVNSLSEQKKFKLFIDKKMVDNTTKGTFNCYGLSQGGAVPWF